MDVKWIRHLPEDQVAGFKQQVLGNQKLWDRLRDILIEMEGNILRTETSSDMYDAGYPARQAYLNGQKKVLKELKDLIDFKER